MRIWTLENLSGTWLCSRTGVSATTDLGHSSSLGECTTTMVAFRRATHWNTHRKSFLLREGWSRRTVEAHITSARLPRALAPSESNYYAKVSSSKCSFPCGCPCSPAFAVTAGMQPQYLPLDEAEPLQYIELGDVCILVGFSLLRLFIPHDEFPGWAS